MTDFKPMLAKDADLSKLTFPVIVQAKLDGIRCCIVNGKPVSRTLKDIPNKEIFSMLSHPVLEGLDGEIIVGPVTAKDAYRRTASFVMAPNKTGEPWCFHVFDKWDAPGSFPARWAINDHIVGVTARIPLQIVNYSGASGPVGLLLLEDGFIAAGHEGVIIRIPDMPYKFGRSGVKGPLLKLKRFVDFEAEIVGCYEEMHNGNEATKDAFGRTERSSVQANKSGKGRLGGFDLQALNGPWAGAEFRCGTGFDAMRRQMFWDDWTRSPSMLMGNTVKVKAFDIGSKDKPRHPVFLGFRDMEVDS